MRGARRRAGGRGDGRAWVGAGGAKEREFVGGAVEPAVQGRGRGAIIFIAPEPVPSILRLQRRRAGSTRGGALRTRFGGCGAGQGARAGATMRRADDDQARPRLGARGSRVGDDAASRGGGEDADLLQGSKAVGAPAPDRGGGGARRRRRGGSAPGAPVSGRAASSSDRAGIPAEARPERAPPRRPGGEGGTCPGGRREVGVRWGGESGDRAKAGCGVWRNAAPASKAEGGRAAAASGPLRRSAGEQPGRRRHPSGLAGFCKNRFGPFEEGRGFSAAVGGGLPGFLASEADAKAPARITLRRAERRGRIFPRMRRWEIHSLREGRNWGKLIYIVSIEIL